MGRWGITGGVEFVQEGDDEARYLVSVHALLLVGVHGEIRVVACGGNSTPVGTVVRGRRVERAARRRDGRHDVGFWGRERSPVTV